MVRGDLQNKDLIGDIWFPTASMRTLKYFFVDAVKHKERVLMEAVVNQMSPIKSLFCRSPLTIILNFKFSRLLSDF